MSTCRACGARRRRPGSFCDRCGRGPDVAAGLDLVVEVDGEPGGVEHDVVLAPRRRTGAPRWALPAVAVAAGALAIGAVAGRDDERAAPITTTVPVVRLTQAASTTVMADGAAAMRAPAPVTVAGPLDRPPLDAATGLALWTVYQGRLHHVDLDTGTVTDRRIDVGSRTLRATSLGVVVGKRDGTLALVSDAGDVSVLSDGPARFLGEGPPGRLWFHEFVGVDRRVTLWYRDGPTGARTRVTLPVERPVAPDGATGALVGAPGGVYRVGGATPQLLVNGRLVDARNGRALVYGCDRGLDCAYLVVDVRSGVSRRAALGGAADAGRSIGLSPDGEWVLISGRATGPVEAVRLDTGEPPVVLAPAEAVACVGTDCERGPSWSPAGDWLAGILDPATVWLWHPGDAAVRTVRLDMPSGLFVSGLVAVTGRTP